MVVLDLDLLTERRFGFLRTIWLPSINVSRFLFDGVMEASRKEDFLGGLGEKRDLPCFLLFLVSFSMSRNFPCFFPTKESNLEFLWRHLSLIGMLTFFDIVYVYLSRKLDVMVVPAETRMGHFSGGSEPHSPSQSLIFEEVPLVGSDGDTSLMISTLLRTSSIGLCRIFEKRFSKSSELWSPRQPSRSVFELPPSPRLSVSRSSEMLRTVSGGPFVFPFRVVIELGGPVCKMMIKS